MYEYTPFKYFASTFTSTSEKLPNGTCHITLKTPLESATTFW